MARFGLDYSAGRISPASHKAVGSSFACRYLSNSPSKNISRGEADELRKGGIDVVVVWETTANRALSGHAGGKSDANEAVNQARNCGIPTGRPIFFAIDFDESASQASAVEQYFKGVNEVLGVGRTGAYGSYYAVKRLFDAKVIGYAWQTYAWSGGNWDSRAGLQQYSNDHSVAGIGVDYNHAVKDDFGQWDYKHGQPSPAPSPQAHIPTLHVDWFGRSHNRQSPDCKVWQKKMQDRGWTIKVDGVFGDQSYAVCRGFQRNHRLVTDGRVGPDTWKATFSSGSQGTPTPMK